MEIDCQLYVDDIEPPEPGGLVRFCDRESKYLGISRFDGSCLPDEGKTGGKYDLQVKLTPQIGEPDVSVEENTVTISKPFECIALKEETWLEVRHDGELLFQFTLRREKVPEWISAKGDTGFIHMQLTYDEKRTIESSSDSPSTTAKFCRKGASLTDPTTPGVREHGYISAGASGTYAVEADIETVYVATNHGNEIQAYNLQGDCRWRTDVGVNPQNFAVGDGMVVADCRSIYESDLENDYVCALDAETGEIRWRFESTEATATAIATVPAPAAGTEKDRPLAITVYADAVIAHDLHTGDRRWECTFESALQNAPRILEPSETADETAPVVLLQEDAGRFLAAVDAATGEVRWQFRPDADIGSITIDGDIVYVSTGDGRVVVLDATIGEIRWQFRPDADIGATTIDDDTVYIGTDNGQVVALDVATGEIQRTLDVDGPVTQDIAVGEGLLLVGYPNQQAHAFDLETWGSVWTVDVPNEQANLPCFAAD